MRPSDVPMLIRCDRSLSDAIVITFKMNITVTSHIIIMGAKAWMTHACGDVCMCLREAMQHIWCPRYFLISVYIYFAIIRLWSICSWWRHQMETFSALLAICAGNSSVPGEFPAQRPVTRSFDVFFDLHPNKRLSKQWWGWWFETPSCPFWRYRNVLQLTELLGALWSCGVVWSWRCVCWSLGDVNRNYLVHNTHCTPRRVKHPLLI